jgi:hypothetical protein
VDAAERPDSGRFLFSGDESSDTHSRLEGGIFVRPSAAATTHLTRSELSECCCVPVTWFVRHWRSPCTATSPRQMATPPATTTGHGWNALPVNARHGAACVDTPCDPNHRPEPRTPRHPPYFPHLRGGESDHTRVEATVTQPTRLVSPLFMYTIYCAGLDPIPGGGAAGWHYGCVQQVLENCDPRTQRSRLAPVRALIPRVCVWPLR